MSIKSELKMIEKQNKGVLTADAVVKFAKDPNTELHKQFTWDNNEAAHQYRLWQARQLIVRVVYEPSETKEELVSVRSQKYYNCYDEEGNRGYYDLVSILQSPEKRESLLNTALRELKAFKSKYQQLKELSEVFDAIDNVKVK